ncbi:hypothetical protein AAH991_19005 [Microbispora sp. ZYX-F-249]|uniref:DUF4232 domain-containing protein n=1 Tax=Microbispora maris TaxID=3144104 RepID=A0ABV0APL3_9ACTN
MGRCPRPAAPAHPASSPHSSLSGQGSGHRLHRFPDTARTAARFAEVDLVSDVKGRAALTDPKPVNPWGLAMGAALRVSNAGTGTATVYTGGAGTARKAPTTVTIPGGTPTGRVAYTGDAFTIKGRAGTAPASFIRPATGTATPAPTGSAGPGPSHSHPAGRPAGGYGH